ncbi:MAG: ribonuclease J [Candidatus Pacebacteria bacterium]|nr:ribonuclease J [Candidatus Paceibacterota bacterium]
MEKRTQSNTTRKRPTRSRRNEIRVARKSGSTKKTTTKNRSRSHTTRGQNTSTKKTTRQAHGTKKTTKRRARKRAFRRPQTQSAPLRHRKAQVDPKAPKIPAITDEDTFRVIPVSGVEEIGRNMIIFENKDDIIVFDAGFQFVSEASQAPGINYILPNTQYLEERKDKIRALVITHGHLDHIGGIPFIMERIGNPPVYTQHLTSLMILKRQEEFPYMDPITMNVVTEGDSFTVGNTRVKTFPVTHSIPDAMGVSVETKHGNVVITGDIRLTHEDGDVVKEERESWENVGKDNNVLLMADSTNADREGFSAPESVVFESLERLIRDTKGRMIIGTFASQFERLIHIIKMAEKYGKYVVPEGRSIKTHIDIALKAKMLEVKPGVIISGPQMQDYPADRIVILATGAQGEEFAALMRMATDKHKHVTLNERDTLVLSSSVIPGNEIPVQKLKDNIYRKNVRVVNYKSDTVHSSGHGNAGELCWIRQTVKPKFLVPVHGHHFHLKSHRYAAIDTGFPKDNIFVPDNGTIIDVTHGTKVTVQKQKAPTELVMVDGFSVGTRQEVVIRDRQSLANDGMFVIIATVNTQSGKLRKSPDIISRGFVYLRENQQLLSEARVLVKKTVEKQTEKMHPLDLDYVKDELTETLSAFLLQKTNKTPMVIPVLIGL